MFVLNIFQFNIILFKISISNTNFENDDIELKKYFNTHNVVVDEK